MSNAERYCRHCNSSFTVPSKHWIPNGPKQYRCSIKRKEISAAYYAQTRETRILVRKKYEISSKDKIRLYKKLKRQKDTQTKLRDIFRSRIKKALKNNYIGKLELLGGTITQWKLHLESQFKKGMTWNNYGDWHIDHILPIASFDMTCFNEVRKAFNYKNTQPLWAVENLTKGRKVV